MKKCILGGTFDPIHNGHLRMAEAAKSAFGLNQIILMTAGDPYFKTSTHHITPALKRLDMTKLAAADKDYLSASDLEVKRPGHTYSCETLCELKKLEPDTDWYFMIGADCLEHIHKWYRPDLIFSCASVIAANRNDQVSAKIFKAACDRLAASFGAVIYMLDWEGADISSSAIRNSVMRGDYDIPVPNGVLNYIRTNGLYLQEISEQSICEWLKNEISPSRLVHTKNVADTAQMLAKQWGESEKRARIAALLHDCAKSEGNALTHAALGAVKAKTVFEIKDEGIISAIEDHTTGAPGMPLLSKIIYVADYIEPGRTKAVQLGKLRELAFTDLDAAVSLIAKNTLEYLKETGAVIDDKTRQVYNYYCR